jgi:hypothetical protein
MHWQLGQINRNLRILAIQIGDMQSILSAQATIFFTGMPLNSKQA